MFRPIASGLMILLLSQAQPLQAEGDSPAPAPAAAPAAAPAPATEAPPRKAESVSEFIPEAKPDPAKPDAPQAKPDAPKAEPAAPTEGSEKVDIIRPVVKPAKAEPVIVSEADAKAAEEAFEAGRKLFFQGDYRGAVDKLKAAVRGNPGKVGYKLLLAKALRYSDDHDGSANLLAEIVAADPEHVEAGLELAELLSPDKQPDRVIAILEPLLKFKHDYPLFHLLAEAYYQKENFPKAREYYEEAVKLNPQADRDFYQLANIYLAQKHFAKSATAYETAARLGVESAALHFKLASVYFNLHNYLGNVTTAEIRGGEVDQIKNALYLIDRVPGKKDTFYVATPRSAVYQAARARELGIDVFELRFLEANTWLSARRYAKADKIYTELQAKVKKEDAGLFWFYWSQTALGLDQFDNYLTRLDKAIEAEPTVYKSMLADAYVTVANRYQQRGDSKRFIEYLLKAVGNNPLSARLHLSLADAYWQAGEKKPAIEQYKLVLELEPDHVHRVRLLNRIRGQEETTLNPLPIAES